MSFAVISEADLLRVLAQLDPHEHVAAAAALGYDAKALQSLSAWRDATFALTQPVASPAMKSPAAQRLLRLGDDEAESRGSVDIPAWLEMGEPPSESVFESSPDAVPPRVAPFVPSPRFASFLRRNLTEDCAGRLPDLAKIVREIALLRPILKWPPAARPRWPSTLQLVVDTGAAVNPFRQDLAPLAKQIQRTLGRRVKLYRSDGDPTRLVNQHGQEAHLRLGQVPLVVLSDGGQYRPGSASHRRWTACGEKQRRSGGKAFLLAPIAARRLDPATTAAFSVIVLDDGPRLRIARSGIALPSDEAPRDLTDGAVILRAALFGNAYVPATLFRQLRRELQGAGIDVDIATENEVWHDSAVIASTNACALRPESRDDISQDFARLSDALRHTVVRTHWEALLAMSPLVRTEYAQLVLPLMTRKSEMATVLRNACAEGERLMKCAALWLFHGPEELTQDVADFMLRLASRSERLIGDGGEAVQTAWALATRSLLLQNDVKLPAGLDTDRLRWMLGSLPGQDWAIRSSDKNLRQALLPSSAQGAPNNLSSAPNSPRALHPAARTPPVAGSASASRRYPHHLNPSLTFETLVPGRANQMARTAALHVAGAPGITYNPLFIYGGVGLGKTHLIHSVGNALLKDRPDARVLYLHAEQFISDVVKNYQRKTFDELTAKYHSLDLLLIDDVHFFAGKDRTQEEFFNAFNALVAKKAHVIMTSHTYPKGLEDIDERLTSHFDSGLTVAIEPPELEMRVALLVKKAEAESTPMPEDVAFFVAKNVRANVRELEGALRKVLAYAKFSHKVVSITLAREALKDLLNIQSRQIGVENIQKTVADFYKVGVATMYSKRRTAEIAAPRQIAMYLAKEITQKSLPEIGELFGGRDHTTVLHAVRKIAGERQKNPELNQQLRLLERTLKG